MGFLNVVVEVGCCGKLSRDGGALSCVSGAFTEVVVTLIFYQFTLRFYRDLPSVTQPREGPPRSENHASAGYGDGLKQHNICIVYPEYEIARARRRNDNRTTIHRLTV